MHWTWSWHSPSHVSHLENAAEAVPTCDCDHPVETTVAPASEQGKSYYFDVRARQPPTKKELLNKTTRDINLTYKAESTWHSMLFFLVKHRWLENLNDDTGERDALDLILTIDWSMLHPLWLVHWHSCQKMYEPTLGQFWWWKEVKINPFLPLMFHISKTQQRQSLPATVTALSRPQ